jgi:hypothetical protein
MGRETGLPQLLAPLLLTGGKGADLVIYGNVVLNTFVLGQKQSRVVLTPPPEFLAQNEHM